MKLVSLGEDNKLVPSTIARSGPYAPSQNLSFCLGLRSLEPSVTTVDGTARTYLPEYATIEVMKSVKNKQLIPLMLNPIKAGFPNPAEDNVEQMIDFNSLIIKHPAATFALKVEGDSMEGAGVYAGDIVIVDRSLQAKHRDIVVATLDGDFTLKYLEQLAGQSPRLVAANPNYAPIDLEQTQEANIWGVVTHCIHGFIGGSHA